MERSSRVESRAVRCLPAKTSRRWDDGRLVRRARRDFRVETDVVAGRVRGMAGDRELGMIQPGRGLRRHLLSPARFLTKIWSVSAASEDKEETDDEREERMVEVVGRPKRRS